MSTKRTAQWVDAQCTPHPIKCFLQKVTLMRAPDRIANRTYIRATGYPSQPFDLGMANARAKGKGDSLAYARFGWA
jgi:hypothetical protein